MNLKVLFFGLILVLSVANITAQEKLSFKEKKELYPSKGYKFQEGDKYNPTTAVVLSALIPGVGQMYAGETGRGLAFLGANVASIVLFVSGAATNLSTSDLECNGNTCTSDANGQPLIILGLAGYLTTWIWSMIDADSVAKVNSQYKKSGQATQVKILPTTNLVNINGSMAPTFGLSFSF